MNGSSENTKKKKLKRKMEEVDQKMMSASDSNNMIYKDQDANMLPGYRFHPTDEELVRFYLRRKVENKPIRLDLIKHVDIYKYDPWDLPKESGDKEWYFFCRRGRKYRNSIRPNRVTKSGFWKATGIDKPVYSVGDFHNCIGLKKSLVYYRGSAGKGTKTDWMMHEFRLPASSNNDTSIKNSTQEAEVWTLCRILKREHTSCGKYTSNNWRMTTLNPKQSVASKTCSSESDATFGALAANDQSERSPLFNNVHTYEGNQFSLGWLSLNDDVNNPNSCMSFPNTPNEEMLTSNGNWDELRPMVDCVLNPSLLYSYT